MEKTIECNDCGWITDVEITDLNARRYCPGDGGLVVSGTGEPWPTPDSALSGLPGTYPADEVDRHLGHPARSTASEAHPGGSSCPGPGAPDSGAV